MAINFEELKKEVQTLSMQEKATLAHSLIEDLESTVDENAESLWIEEAKSQLGLAHLKTDSFLANAALFQCAILAYNTLRWMALSSGNTQLKQWEPNSIRVHLICIAGKLLTGGRQIRIKLPTHHLHPNPWKDWLALA